MSVATRVLCACDRRRAAQADGTLVYWAERRAWTFLDLPSRGMSPAARYHAFCEREGYPHRDHSGEPYMWTSCAFCGHSLPGVDDPDAQADGTPH